ncbi:MAG: hypothetical protein ACYC63_18900 [Armatimonadota bacterium]
MPIAALLAAAPAWANFSWGQLGQFRPGIQMGMVVLVILAEIAIIKPMTQMTWGVAAAAVVGANIVTGVMGRFLIYDSFKFTRLDHLAILVIPGTIIEFVVINEAARAWSRRQAQRSEWALSACWWRTCSARWSPLATSTPTIAMRFSQYCGVRGEQCAIRRTLYGAAAQARPTISRVS